MGVLPSDLRNRLETTVKAARRQAEAAARAALERLTVGNAEPGGHLGVEERQLRNRLRAHGRQLGDRRDAKAGTQSTNRLIHECAYEHWHRMLFARFLSENHLLIHEKEGMPVTLAECDELAADEGAPDGWTLAARYAARMLPQIFRPDDPALQVGFAPEHKRGLEKLVTELLAQFLRRKTAWAGFTSSGRPSAKMRSTPPATRSRARRYLPSRSCSPSITWCCSCCTTPSARGGQQG
jgi:hypothetical protein